MRLSLYYLNQDDNDDDDMNAIIVIPELQAKVLRIRVVDVLPRPKTVTVRG